MLSRSLLISTLFIFATTAAGCKGDVAALLGSSSSPETDGTTTSPESEDEIGTFKVDFVDSAQAGNLSASSVIDPLLGGLFFGELEIVAYNYRPGETIQRTHFENGYAGPDWSYWVLLQGGYDTSKDLLLKPNERLDISALNQVLNPAQDKEFIKEVGTFSVDFFEVAAYRPGVIYNGEFHHNGAASSDHPLHLYPELISLPTYESHPGVGGFAGFPGHGSASDATHRMGVFSIVFARDDWFTEPVLVYFDSRSTIGGSSKPLSSFQSEVLKSLVSQSTHRRTMDHLIIVPYTRQSVALKREHVGQGGARASAKVQVSFDFSDILEDSPTFAGASSVLKFRRDATDVPFGTKLTIKPK